MPEREDEIDAEMERDLARLEVLSEFPHNPLGPVRMHRLADEIVSLRQESTALRALILRIMDAMNNGRALSDRILSDDFPAEITRMREALAAATRAENGAWSVSRWHVANRGGWVKLDGTTRTTLPQYSREQAEQLAAWWDRVEPNNAPHRVFRVALVSEESANGSNISNSSTRVKEALAALSHDTEQSSGDSYITITLDTAAKICAALEGPRD